MSQCKLSQPLLQGLFSCQDFLRIVSNTWLLCFKAFLNLYTSGSKSRPRVLGAFTCRRKSSCSEARATGPPQHFGFSATIRLASGKHHLGHIKTDSQEYLYARAQAGRKRQGQAHVCRSLSRTSCLEELLTAGRTAATDCSAPNAAAPRESKESSTGGAISWVRLSASASRQCV